MIQKQESMWSIYIYPRKEEK